MLREIVLTLTGPDRVGLVEDVTRLLLDRGGNVETSRMARLGGAFAILMHASLPEARVSEIPGAFDALVAQGYKLTLSQIDGEGGIATPGWMHYQIEVRGADQEGIIHHVSQTLAERGINIESMDTETSAAAMSGAPLFTMKARVAAPRGQTVHDLRTALDQVGREMNVDIAVMPI